MNFEGQITHVLELQKGETKEGKQWAKREVVVKESNPRNEDYPEVIKVEFFKMDDNIKWINEEWKHKQGDNVVLEGLSFKTSEWKGKYYTNISCYKIEAKLGMNDGGSVAPGGVGKPASVDGIDDLPFNIFCYKEI